MVEKHIQMQELTEKMKDKKEEKEWSESKR